MNRITNPIQSTPKPKASHPPYRIFLHGFERGGLVDIPSERLTPTYRRRIACEKSFLSHSPTYPKYYAIHYIIQVLLASTLGKRGCIFTDNIDHANVLVESTFTHYSLHARKPWKLSVLVSYHPILDTPTEMVDLFSQYTAIISPFGLGHPTCIDFLPFFAYLTFPDNIWPDIVERPFRREIPPKFACCITPDVGIYYRDRMIQELSKYKAVDSISTTNLDVLSQYKFVVCFESAVEGTYITEKIIQVFLAGVVPVYFGASIHTQLFNPNAYVSLEKDATTEYASLVRRIVYLDKHDSRYIEMIHQSVFTDFDIVDELREQYGVDAVVQQLNHRIATTLAKA